MTGILMSSGANALRSGSARMASSPARRAETQGERAALDDAWAQRRGIRDERGPSR